MTILLSKLCKSFLGVLALLLLVALPLRAGAAGIGFRNDLKTPILVQGSSVVENMVRRGPQFLVNPGRTAWDSNLKSGKRQVIIYDANQPNRVLLRETISFNGQELFYSVCPCSVTGTTKLVPE